MAIQLLLLSVGLYIAAALGCLLVIQSNRAARWVSGLGGLAASLVGMGAALSGLSRLLLPPAEARLFGVAPFGALSLGLDGLSALMVGVIALLGAATSLYSIPYLQAYEERSLGGLGFFNNLFLAAMLLVVTVTNAFYFLVFWELMTLASYFLVIFDDDNPEAIQAGYLYMLVAHGGAALIMLAFLVFYSGAGSFDFAAFRSAALSPTARSLAFLLAFFGFGAKAGIVPLHIWLPRAHPAAPSHVSALMSGVMIKTAIYGILRVGMDFLGGGVWWWGLVVLSFGALSAVLGVLYALAENDLKRLLAYSSVENIGIILMGAGAGMVGLALKLPLLAFMGLLAALYHLVNHACFKGLLFLGAGSVIYRTHTKNLNRLGGLARNMPWTSLGFLIGALAVSAIPPLNGFASEWITYQALFLASQSQHLLRGLAPLFALLLALTGALAAMCFVKAYGGAFSGPARSPAAEQAREAPQGMLVAMGLLVMACLGLGLGVQPVVMTIELVEIGFLAPSLQGTRWTLSGTEPVGALAIPLIVMLLLGLLFVPLFLITMYGGRRAGRRSAAQPWSCGYGYRPTMSATPGSFDQSVRLAFRPLYRLRDWMVPPLQATAAFSRRAVSAILRFEPVVEESVSRPTIRLVETAGQWIQGLQMGDIRVYCFYIIATLAILLILVFR